MNFRHPECVNNVAWVQCFGWPVSGGVDENGTAALVWLCYDTGLPNNKRLVLARVGLKVSY